MTYCSDQNLDFEGKPLKAYIANQYYPTSGKVGLTSISKVPAETGIVIKSENEDLPGAFDVSEYITDATVSADVSANMLKGVLSAETEVPKIDGDYTNFVLSFGSKGIGFYPLGKAGKIGANKAYLQIETDVVYPTTSANGITLEFADETDAIQGVETKTVEDGAWYTIQGVRVAQPTQSGIYIHNGRKVVVK